jgi:hypothetical protein
VSVISLNALGPVEVVVTFGYNDDDLRERSFDYGTLTVAGLPPINSMARRPG